MNSPRCARLSFDECWNTFKGWGNLYPEIIGDPKDRPQQTYSELKLFYPYIESLKPRNVMEIGSHVGGTLRFWINAAADGARIIAVERNPEVRRVLPVWETWLNEGQQLFLINRDSMRESDSVLAEVKEILKGEKLDFLFIDGEHRLLFFKSDFETYAPLVRGGGIIAMHDIAPKPLNTAVELADYWRSLKIKLVNVVYVNTLEIIGRHRTTGVAGIGVIILDEDIELSKELLELIGVKQRIETEAFVSFLFNNYWGEVKRLFNEKFTSLSNELLSRGCWVGLKADEAALLYMMVRWFKPKTVFECGTGHGYSSQWILDALRRNGCGHLYSFEILPENIAVAIDLAKRYGFEDISTFIEGDATPSLSCAFGMVGGTQNYDLIPPSKRDTLRRTLEEVCGTDFLFMDGYHNYEFGKWWTTQITPYVTKGGIIAVHDIIDLDDDSKQRGMDEHIAVREFLQSHSTFKVLSMSKIQLPPPLMEFSLDPLGLGLIFMREET